MIDYKSFYNDIYIFFEKAEHKIKLIENFPEDLSTPAVNQLRYVAKHLLDAEKILNHDLKVEQLRRAKNHCLRAIYDASEIGIIYLLERFKIFQHDYRKVKIIGTYPEYIAHCKSANIIKDFIAETPIKTTEDQTKFDSNVNKAEDYFVELKKIHEHQNAIRSELNKILEEERQEEINKIEKERQVTLRWKAGISISIILTSLGILTKLLF